MHAEFVKGLRKHPRLEQVLGWDTDGIKVARDIDDRLACEGSLARDLADGWGFLFVL